MFGFFSHTFSLFNLFFCSQTRARRLTHARTPLPGIIGCSLRASVFRGLSQSRRSWFDADKLLTWTSRTGTGFCRSGRAAGPERVQVGSAAAARPQPQRRRRRREGREEEEEVEAFSTEAVRAARTCPLPTARTLPCWIAVRPEPGPGPGSGSGRDASKSSSRSLRSVSPQTYITALRSVRRSGWVWRSARQRPRELLSR